MGRKTLDAYALKETPALRPAPQTEPGKKRQFKVEFPDELFRAIKVYCAEKGITMQELASRAIQDYMENRK